MSTAPTRTMSGASPARLTAGRTRPIDLMIIGAPNAATTSLKEYLGQHPDIRTHASREMIFFASAERVARGYDVVYPIYFPGEVAERVLVAKSVPIMYSEPALIRLREHNADVNVVLLLREPAARAYSDYWFARRHGLEDAETFEAAIEREWDREYESGAGLPATAYIQRSRYAPHVERVLAELGTERTHLFLFEDLRRDPVAICRRIIRLFPEIDPDFEPAVRTRHNRASLPRSGALMRWMRRRKPAALREPLRRAFGGRRMRRLKDWLDRINRRPVEIPPLRADTRRRLRDRFRRDNRRLADILGRDLEIWADSDEAP